MGSCYLPFAGTGLVRAKKKANSVTTVGLNLADHR